MAQESFSRFRSAMGYILPKEQKAVESAKVAKKFLEGLLIKLEATLTMDLTKEGTRRLFLTGRENWFRAEAQIKATRGLLYVESVLAEQFICELDKFLGGKPPVAIRNALDYQQPALNLLADVVATALKPFLQTDLIPEQVGAAPGRIRAIWTHSQPILKEAMASAKSSLPMTSFHRPAWDYLCTDDAVKPETIIIFGQEVSWPSEFGKIAVPAEALLSSPNLPLHVKFFLSELCRQLDKSYALRGTNTHSRTHYEDRHSYSIEASLSQWHWITFAREDLQLEDQTAGLRRQLATFEYEMSVKLYSSLLDRLGVPGEVKKILESGEEEDVAAVVGKVAQLLRNLRDYEFKCPARPWERDSWKDNVRQFWSDNKDPDLPTGGLEEDETGGRKKLKKRKAEESDESEDDESAGSWREEEDDGSEYDTMESGVEKKTPRMPAGRDCPSIPDSSPPSLLPTPVDSEEDLPDDIHNAGEIGWQELEAALESEDFIEAKLVFKSLEGCHDQRRHFVNRVLQEAGAVLELKGTETDWTSFQVTIAKEGKSLCETACRLEKSGNLMAQVLSSVVKSLRDKFLISSEDEAKLRLGQPASDSLIRSVVDSLEETYEFGE